MNPHDQIHSTLVDKRSGTRLIRTLLIGAAIGAAIAWGSSDCHARDCEIEALRAMHAAHNRDLGYSETQQLRALDRAAPNLPPIDLDEWEFIVRSVYMMDWASPRTMYMFQQHRCNAVKSRI